MGATVLVIAVVTVLDAVALLHRADVTTSVATTDRVVGATLARCSRVAFSRDTRNVRLRDQVPPGFLEFFVDLLCDALDVCRVR